VGETELRQHRARRRDAEALDQVFAQQPHRDRVEQQGAFASEANHSAVEVELQQLFVIEVVCAH
jgi:hypothetical protein